jgi:hypothetical protein
VRKKVKLLLSPSQTKKRGRAKNKNSSDKKSIIGISHPIVSIQKNLPTGKSVNWNEKSYIREFLSSPYNGAKNQKTPLHT